MDFVEATEADLDALVEQWYALAADMEQYDELNELAYADVSEVSDEGFRAHLDDDSITNYLLRVDGERVGFTTLREGRHPSRTYSHYLRIVNLYVPPDHRNEGYGTAAVEQAKEIASEHGCDHLKVSCEWGNDGARRLYEACGFRPKQVDYAQGLD